MPTFVENFSPSGLPIGVGVNPLVTIPIPTAGLYHVTGWAGLQRDPAVGFFNVGLMVNGNLLSDFGTVGYALRADTDTQAEVSADLQLQAGDAVTLWIGKLSAPALLTSQKATLSAFLVT
jgi:hypothetical protein